MPVHAIGFGVDVVAGQGAGGGRAVPAAADLARLRPLEPETDIPYVTETVRLVRRASSTRSTSR